MTVRPPLPPFTAEIAAQKVRIAEDAWKGRDPARVALAYTPDSRWRNRSAFLVGRAAIEAFLAAKWQREREYRLIKELWAAAGDRLAGQTRERVTTAAFWSPAQPRSAK